MIIIAGIVLVIILKITVETVLTPLVFTIIIYTVLLQFPWVGSRGYGHLGGKKIDCDNFGYKKIMKILFQKF